MVVTAAVLALLAVLVVPPDVRALAAYYEKGAREDWRGAAQYLTRWVRPSDVVVYWGDRGWRTTVAKPVLFYADRVPQNDGILDRVASFGTQDPQELRTIVQTHADTTVWVVSRDNGSWRDLDPIAPLLASFMPIRVRACGAPDGQPRTQRRLRDCSPPEELSRQRRAHGRAKRICWRTRAASFQQLAVGCSYRSSRGIPPRRHGKLRTRAPGEVVPVAAKRTPKTQR